jgi:hypothetical protein
MLKTSVRMQYSKYGTFNSDVEISFLRGSGIASHIYGFCYESSKILCTVYPGVLDKNVDKRKLAAQISRELTEFSPYLAVDISIIHDAKNGFQIVLRDPENIGNTFLDRFANMKRRSYVDAQLHTVALFLLDKQANHPAPVSRLPLNNFI